jgi:superfamily II DNA or RNA helicase
VEHFIMRLQLRDYQEGAVAAAIREIENDKDPLVVLPTGGGKSLVLAEIARRLNEPMLVLSHVKELLEQDALALRYIAPEIGQGFFCAGLKEKKPNAQVVFGSVQSVFRSLEVFRSFRRVVAVDEAHLCPRKADAMYGKVFEHFAAARKLGLTATPSRMDSGSLVDGEDAWFNCIAYDLDPGELIKRGFLVPLSGVLPPQQADMKGVGKVAGDFAQGQAERAVSSTLSLEQAVASAKLYAAGRKAWLVFAAGIKHAQEVKAALDAQKVSAEIVTSETPTEERQDILARFKANEFRALVNVGVLTTGFDAPITDAIICFRPTHSKVLWQQMLGRGMRLYAGKGDCLLLDYVGNLERLGGVGVVLDKIKDDRAIDPLKIKREQQKRGPREERRGPEEYQLSTMDPMMTGALFDAIVRGMKFWCVRSKRYPGKSMLVAEYQLQDEQGRGLSARAFLCVEYEAAALSHSLRWFSRRGMDRDMVPRNAQSAMTYAMALPRPEEVSVRYDSSINCFTVESERFAENALSL